MLLDEHCTLFPGGLIVAAFTHVDTTRKPEDVPFSFTSKRGLQEVGLRRSRNAAEFAIS